MADAAVKFMLETLKNLLLYQRHLISDGSVQNQVERLDADLRRLKVLLKDSTKKQRQDGSLRELDRQIRDVVYEVEDIIDAFVTQAEESKTKSYFHRAFKSPVKLLDITKQVEAVGVMVKQIYERSSSFDFASLPLEREESQAPMRGDNVVGFEDEAKKIIACLNKKTEQLDVISIVGMPGLGKTTLAWKIFRDPEIQWEFPIRVWVYVSQEFTRKHIFLTILRVLITDLTEDMYHKTDYELAQLINDNLESKRFLIVFDDLWTPLDWDKIRIALPKTNNLGKVLITSRREILVGDGNQNGFCHKMRWFDEDESWLLLRLEVFGKSECPIELEVVGKRIAKQCYGLPLAVVVTGYILARKYSVSDKMFAIDDEDARTRALRMEKIIGLSYDELPYHLRECFLYLGMFPPDFEIPVSKLIRMWIAEGFVQANVVTITLEETAENYLDDLIDRNLVIIDKIKHDGKVKTCRIHPILGDFCRGKAGNEKENFFQEMKRHGEGIFDPPITNLGNYRRLCIYSNVLDFISCKPYGRRVRSFVCFSDKEVTLEKETNSAIPTSFKLLRVLDVKPIKFTKIPSDMYYLVHLKYIVLSINLAILPSAFSKLRNIQTLVVYTTSPILEIKAHIWEMIRLRHLKTNVSTTLPKSGKTSRDVENLQTLGTISPESCTQEVYDRARNLKKLGIRGKLALLLDGKVGSSFDSLRNLEKLKLLNDVFPNSPSEGKLCSLPPPYKFPWTLKSLTLAHTFLDWSHLNDLGLLENLQVLKLKDEAFVGTNWEVAEGGFPHLEILHIGRTDLQVWKANENHFPSLRHLELRNCEELLQFPTGLVHIPSLQHLELYHCKSAAASAKKIHEAKEKQNEQTSEVISVCKLYIFPPDQ